MWCQHNNCHTGTLAITQTSGRSEKQTIHYPQSSQHKIKIANIATHHLVDCYIPPLNLKYVTLCKIQMNNNSEVRGQSLSSHLSRKTKTFTFLSSGSPVVRCQSKKEHMLLKDSSFHRRGMLLELASSAFSSSSSSTSGNLKLVFKGGKEVSPNMLHKSCEHIVASSKVQTFMVFPLK